MKEVLKMGKLDGKVALITGAGSGIGRATALLLAKEGAKVTVVDRFPAGGRKTVRMIEEAGGEAMFIKADVSRSADVEKMVKTTVDTYGRIDILYNNAGILGTYAPAVHTTEEEWDSIIDTNLKGVFLGAKYAIPAMVNQGGGVIINTGSTSGILGVAGMPAYSASKAGVIQLTKVMALECANLNIRVNCICPGGIRTPMVRDIPEETFRKGQPVGRAGRPEEIAQAVLYLASDDASFATGAVLVVDGGVTAGIMP